jgi:hypothetical protein
MPWNKVTQMEELNRFVILAQTDRFTLTDLDNVRNLAHIF